jgi:alpha-glucosidase
MIDLVISHTSDQHPWFAESRSNRDNHKADWYVWADSKPDGSPPNNWLSIFGGSAWEWDTNRRQYYMHNFLTSQPDLNFHNPEVQDALLDIVRFWLELGVDGFRLDTINFYFHAQTLKDNPPLPPEVRNASIAPEVNPYNYQDHLYDKSQPENIEFLKRFRAVLDEFPALPRSARWAMRSAAWRSWPNTPPAMTASTCAIPSTSWRPNRSRRKRCAGSSRIRERGARRLVLLGVLQP